MKRIIIIALSILLALPACASAAVIEPARMSLVYGDVMYRTTENDDWEPAAINTPLDEGDAVWCPDGARAEIQLPDGSVVRLDGGSHLNLLVNEGSFLHFNLGSGRLYLRTARTSSENSLQIDADDTTVLPSSRTRLRLDMLANGQEDVSIFKGSAYVEGNGSRTKVRAGEQISLDENYSELLPLNPPDSWEDWNLDRDRIQANAALNGSYLPDELRSYSGELEANGSWVQAADYGMVWRPTVILADQWAPYRSGRWVWRRGDYVWVSSESWGWAPYHYGRWTVIGNFGWCWIPPSRGDVYWGPGYVGWYRTGSHVGWTPLAPGETYYGYGRHGRHSVDIATTTVNISTVSYGNRRHRGGVTVVAQNDFLRGRVAAVQPAAQSSVQVSLGSPRIKPPKEQRPSRDRHTRSQQAAPQRERQSIGDLRQRFPRVTPEPPDRKTQQQDVPRTDPRQQGQPSKRLVSAPAVQPQTVIRHEEKSRQGADSAPRQQSQQAAAVPPQQTGTLSGVAAASQQPQQASGRQEEKLRRDAARREQKQKKVWRVKTPENGREKAAKPAESKEQDGRDKGRKEKQ